MKIQQILQNLLETQVLFLFDAVVLALAGSFLLVMPQFAAPYFPDQPWATISALRAVGCLFLFAAIVSASLAYTVDHRARFFGVVLFASLHVLLAALLTITPGRFSAPIFIGSCEMGKSTAIGPMCYQLTNAGLGLRHPWLGTFSWVLAVQFLAGIYGAWSSRLNLRDKWAEQIRQAASQEERNRLARDLHDSIKQQIFAIQTSVAAAQVRLANGSEGATAALEDARQSAREATAEMEAMLHQLQQAAPLENEGLVSAIRQQCEALGFRTGAKVNLEIGDLPASTDLPPGAQQVTHRIVQESLANIAKHARASVVDVWLGRDEDGGLGLHINDNGQGFDIVKTPRGMGLRNLDARAQELGGAVAVRSTPGVGTLIEMTIPVQKSGHARDLRWFAATFVAVELISNYVPWWIMGVLASGYFFWRLFLRKRIA